MGHTKKKIGFLSETPFNLQQRIPGNQDPTLWKKFYVKN